MWISFSKTSTRFDSGRLLDFIARVSRNYPPLSIPFTTPLALPKSILPA